MTAISQHQKRIISFIPNKDQLLTLGDLENFKVEILNEIKQLVNTQVAPAKKWLRSSEVKSLLKISPGTLQNLRINGTITFRKMGSIFYYPYDAIAKILEEGGSCD